MVCCLVCGCEEKAKRIGTPQNYPPAHDRILCPNCGEMTSSVYKKSYKRFWFCFIPCCCTSNVSDPYMACISCQKPISVNRAYKCTNCGLATTFKSNNCPSCGSEKRRL